jgi:hypothetical protein
VMRSFLRTSSEIDTLIYGITKLSTFSDLRESLKRTAPISAQ